MILKYDVITYYNILYNTIMVYNLMDIKSNEFLNTSTYIHTLIN